MEIRQDSLLHSDNYRYDYMDSYEYMIIDPKDKIGIPEIAETFIQPGPKWFEGLFVLRHRIASVFKLKTPATVKDEMDNRHNKWEIGARAGIFRIFAKTENEIIFGEDDKHLNLRVSLLLDQNNPSKDEKKVTVTTVVELNNHLGQIYFSIVKPFHKTVIPFLLKRNFKQLEQEVNK